MSFPFVHLWRFRGGRVRRTRPAALGRGESPLVVCPLEERRVLTVSVEAGMDRTGANSINEGGTISLEPATFEDSSQRLFEGGHTAVIDWGDGTVEAGTVDEDARTISGSHTYADNGFYTVTVTVTDGVQNSASDSFAVQVRNVAPQLTVVPDQTVNEGDTLSLVDIGRFTDPGYDNPLNVDGELRERFTYAIDWGDGTDLDSGIATIDTAGSAGVPTAGSFDGSHTYASSGVYTVKVTISDDDGGSATKSFTANVLNVPPELIVAPDQIVDEGSLLQITDIGRFTDPGLGQQANGDGETQDQYTYTIDWGDGTAIDSGVATVDTPGGPEMPTSGSFDGSHIYADNGIYTVTVTVTDPAGGSTSDTFDVVVRNVAPQLVVAEDQTVAEGSPLTITDIGRFTDPGFDNPLNVEGEVQERFTYAIDWGDGTEIDSGPATTDVPGRPGTPTRGSFDGSHVYADNGVYTVTVTVSDDDGGRATAQFLVTVENVAPNLTVGPDRMVDEGSLLVIPDIGRFTDPGFGEVPRFEGQQSESFDYTIDWGDGTPVDTGPATIDVAGSAGTPTSGSFDGSHVYADNGVYTVAVTVRDDDGGVATATFEVTVKNVAPSLAPIADQTIDEGSTLTFDPLGQFTDPGFDNPLNEGGEVAERFTYAIDWGDSTPIDSGPGVIDNPGSPGQLTIGSFAGSHVYGDDGVYLVTVTVSDDDGGSATTTFTVTVNNVAPNLTVAPDQTIAEGSLLTIAELGRFTDPGFGTFFQVEGEPTEQPEQFHYTIDWGDGTAVDAGPAPYINGSPGELTSGSFGGSHVYADNGVYTVTVRVMDDDGGSDTETFNVTVFNVAPTLTVPGNVTSDIGTTIVIPELGQFTDPGFDNPLNVEGETQERFTFAVDWGDGSEIDSGPAAITTPGGPGVLTAGSFDGSHTYSNPGLYTVRVTVSDDDGGSSTQVFTVVVEDERIFVFPPPSPGTVGLTPPGPTSGQPPVFVPMVDLNERPVFAGDAGPAGFRLYRPNTVPGTEARLVLRVVSPDGSEGDDIPLPEDVLDNLRALFRRLPDGRYRIYWIQPNGVERMVVDVVVRGGRSLDPAEAALDEAPPAAEEPQAETPAEPDEEPVPAPADDDQAESIDRAWERWGAVAATAGTIGVVWSAPRAIDRTMEQLDRRSLSRGRRLLRRIAQQSDRSPGARRRLPK